jgi:asparagine synthetase B (glutamine-hydrolysing)
MRFGSYSDSSLIAQAAAQRAQTEPARTIDLGAQSAPIEGRTERNLAKSVANGIENEEHE